jgi:hypothetical protein
MHRIALFENGESRARLAVLLVLDPLDADQSAPDLRVGGSLELEMVRCHDQRFAVGVHELLRRRRGRLLFAEHFPRRVSGGS